MAVLLEPESADGRAALHRLVGIENATAVRHRLATEDHRYVLIVLPLAGTGSDDPIVECAEEPDAALDALSRVRARFGGQLAVSLATSPSFAAVVAEALRHKPPTHPAARA